jgi:hypothetical protein
MAVIVEPALEAERTRAEATDVLSVEVPDNAAFQVVDHHLDALALIGAA